MKHYGDITKINGAEVEPVDVITGGSPCQDLSVAGRREGLAGARSGLFMEQIRIIKEMRENDVRNGRTNESIRPRYMVWENVPRAFSSNGGDDFRCILEETARIADKSTVIPRPADGKWTPAGCIVGNGWSVAWRVHDAQFWGVAQRRRRIALVADFGGESAPEILFERKGVSGDPEQSGAQREETAADVGKSTATASGTNTVPTVYDARGNGDGQTAPTITGDHENRITDYTALCYCETSFAQQNKLINRSSTVRRLTPLECERLQGFPDGWTDIGEWTDSKGKKHKEADAPRYKALGNSIALPFWQWMAERMRLHICNEDQPTMASLFDGIGGFPLVYSRAGFKPVWASEIEEFPIAVTKIRFPEV